MFGKLISVVLLATNIAVHAEAQVQDTIFKKTPLLTGKDALLIGAFTLGTVAVAPIDRQVVRRVAGGLAPPGDAERRRRAAGGRRGRVR